MNILTSMVFMLFINWQLALIVFAILPILLYVAIEFRKRILGQYRNVRKLNSKITGAYNENITGVRVVKALGREDENLREFSQLTGDMYKASYRAAWLSALFLPTVQVISAVALGSIVWYSGQVTDGQYDHRRHFRLYRLCHLYDVADPGPGARLCRNPACHRLRRTHLLPGGCRTGSAGSTRRHRSGFTQGRYRVRPCLLLVRG